VKYARRKSARCVESYLEMLECKHCMYLVRFACISVQFLSEFCVILPMLTVTSKRVVKHECRAAYA